MRTLTTPVRPLACRGPARASFLALAAAVAAVAASGARAGILPASITTADGNGADTYVRGGTFAGQNFSDALSLLSSNAGADLSNANKVYLRFDLSQMPGWTGSTNYASLEIPFQDSGIGATPPLQEFRFSLYALDDGPAELFAENAVNWNNAPANDPNRPGGVGTGATLITPFTLTGEGSGVTVFGEPLIALLNSDTNDLVTFIVTRDTEASPGIDYVHAVAAPQEAFAGPRLAVPEPSTAGLLLLAGTAPMLRRHPRKTRRGTCLICRRRENGHVSALSRPCGPRVSVRVVVAVTGPLRLRESA